MYFLDDTFAGLQGIMAIFCIVVVYYYELIQAYLIISHFLCF